MARFDPVTGKLVAPLDDIQVQPAGSSAPRPRRTADGKRITDTVDQDGKVDGYITEHKDGRQDCDVFAPAVVVAGEVGGAETPQHP
ncbi:MAG: hypothetical protein ACF8PN_04880 [Phycisphaerales bacterium]